MNCGCVYTEHEGESASVHREEIRRARTPHACVECGRQIAPGERYEHSTGCWDGRWTSCSTCTDCMSVRSALFCGAWVYGCVWDDLYEHMVDVCWGGRAGPSLSSLTPRAREAVCEIIEEIWEEQNDE